MGERPKLRDCQILLGKELNYCRSLMQLECREMAGYLTHSAAGSMAANFVANGGCRTFHKPF